MAADDEGSKPMDESELPPLTLEGETEEEAGAVSLPETLGERYDVVSLLGTGAFGEVYRARDRVLGREVAVKRIRLDSFVEAAQLEDVKARFFREAQVAAQLRHPNIVTTHDIVSSPSTNLIVLELVEGETLQTRLQARGRLPLAETLDVLAQVAAALDEAHARGVVHRDVKPANIMIEPSGHVKVMDFGVAKPDTGSNLTSTGLILGTPNYMSPEQARGLPVDGRADVFSLGCVLYECVTGRKPFEGESITAILLKIVTEAPSPVDFAATGLPPALDSVLRRALAKEVDQRFASATELVEAARQAERGFSAPPAPRPEGSGTVVTSAVSAPAASEAPKASRHRVWPLVGAGLAVAVLLAVLVGVQTLTAPAPPPPAEDGRLIVEEELGFVERLLGREPRLFITVPAATALQVELRGPVGSATSSSGDRFEAEIRKAVEVETVEAVTTGARVRGRLANVTPAAEAEGRGTVTLEFRSLRLADGGEVDIEAAPLVLRAPSPAQGKKGFMGSITGSAKALGEMFGVKKRELAWAPIGGSAGSGLAHSEHGADVALEAGHTFDVQLAAPVVVTRPAIVRR